MGWHKALVMAITIMIISFFIVFYAIQLIPMHEGNNKFMNDRIMEFLNVPFNVANIGFLSIKEESHMHDVKKIFNFLFIMLIILVCASVLSLMMVENIHSVLRKTGIILMIISIFLSISSFFNFTAFWTIFHKVLFPQGNWQFSPDSILITLYPEKFFFIFGVAFVTLLAIFGLLLTVAEYLPEWIKKVS